MTKRNTCLALILSAGLTGHALADVDSGTHPDREALKEHYDAVVATHELKRRDKSQPDKVVINPPGPGDVNLRPMSWVIHKMLRMPDDGNTHAYAADMIGYLGLSQYEGDLRQLLASRHPAVSQAASRALEMLGVNESDGSGKGAAVRRTVDGLKLAVFSPFSRRTCSPLRPKPPETADPPQSTHAGGARTCASSPGTQTCSAPT